MAHALRNDVCERTTMKEKGKMEQKERKDTGLIRWAMGRGVSRWK